jgi:hypothetical protein
LKAEALGPRFRGDDGVEVSRALRDIERDPVASAGGGASQPVSSFPRKREPSVFAFTTRKALGPRFRGDDERDANRKLHVVDRHRAASAGMQRTLETLDASLEEHGRSQERRR